MNNSSKRQPKSGSKNNQGRSGRVVELRPNKAPSAALPERVAALEQNQLGLVQFFNTNMGAFKSGMLAVDAMLHVQQRILQDMFNELGSNGLLGTDPGDAPIHVYRDIWGMIDFARYIREYYGFLGFVEFAISWQTWAKTHTATKLEDGTFEIVSTEMADAADAHAEEAEELSAAIAGPVDEIEEEIVTEFGGDTGGVIV